MFTGIVEEVGRVSQVQSGRLVITAGKLLSQMAPGDSIAVNGVCLTITSLSPNSFSVHLMPETIRRTNLERLKSEDWVNLERPLSLNGRLGGHLVQGHIDGTARIAEIKWEGEAMLLTMEASPDLMRYIVAKGFIAVDGISLTVVGRNESSFWVSIATYTREHTNLDRVRLNDLVNLEVDIIAKYVEQFVKPQSSGVTLELLRESGFL